MKRGSKGVGEEDEEDDDGVSSSTSYVTVARRTGSKKKKKKRGRRKASSSSSISTMMAFASSSSVFVGVVGVVVLCGSFLAFWQWRRWKKKKNVSEIDKGSAKKKKNKTVRARPTPTAIANKKKKGGGGSASTTNANSNIPRNKRTVNSNGKIRREVESARRELRRVQLQRDLERAKKKNNGDNSNDVPKDADTIGGKAGKTFTTTSHVKVPKWYADHRTQHGKGGDL